MPKTIWQTIRLVRVLSLCHQPRALSSAHHELCGGINKSNKNYCSKWRLVFVLWLEILLCYQRLRSQQLFAAFGSSACVN